MTTPKILELMGYTDQNIIETNYLTELVELFEIEKDVYKALFHTTQRYYANDEIQPYPIFHKYVLLSELAYCLCYHSALLKEIEYNEEFCLFCQDAWLTFPDNNIFFDFFIKNDLRGKTKEEIIYDYSILVKGKMFEFLGIDG